MAEASIQQQIDHYLLLLSDAEKQAVLTVVKSMATSGITYDDLWQDEEFANELNERTLGYEDGTATLKKFDEMKEEAIRAYR